MRNEENFQKTSEGTSEAAKLPKNREKFAKLHKNTEKVAKNVKIK